MPREGTFGGVDAFMRRLRCDVLCLQETKTSRALLQQQPAAAAAHVDGWDSCPPHAFPHSIFVTI